MPVYPAYYNEIDPYAAQWLRNLIDAKLIAFGVVDERSIADVRADDLRAFTQCHFFAGIGGWSFAARLAGWPDDRALWTGSCPCQPFSNAGKKGGFADERHLWPAFANLIRECRPAVVFGEQVASATAWLGLVRSDLEAMEYAVGAMPIEAASAGADHLRDRYWFVAESNVGHGSNSLRERDAGGFFAPQAGERGANGPQHGNRIVRPEYAGQSGGGFVADDGRGRCGGSRERQGQQSGRAETVGASDSDLADAHDARSQGRPSMPECPDQRIAWPHGVADADFFGQGEERQQRSGQLLRPRRDTQARDGGDLADCTVTGCETQRSDGIRIEPRSNNGLAACAGGSSYEWVIGADGKARRVKPGIRLLAHGIPGRVGKLRGFGNAIDPRPAAAFISAYMECRPRGQTR